MACARSSRAISRASPVGSVPAMSRTAATLALALAAVALTACGGDDEEPTTDTAPDDLNPTTESLEVSAVPDGSLVFEQESLDTEAGAVTVNFTNPAPIAHDFCVEDDGADEIGCTDIVADGDSSTTTLELEPGEYTYFCSVAGHREGGMEGPLTVE
jgi:plastocyanin